MKNKTRRKMASIKKPKKKNEECKTKTTNQKAKGDKK